MQFAYQFPEMTERLVLVSSGGLGPEVSSILRAAALPGAKLFIAATASVGSKVGSAVGRGLAVVGLRPTADIAEIARGYASLVDPDRRAAFLATLRAVVGTGGQRVSANDRLYLAAGIPVLVVWGERDPLIPVQHGRDAHAAIVAARSRSSKASATCRSSRRPDASSRRSSDSSTRTSHRGSTRSSGAAGSASPGSRRAAAEIRSRCRGCCRC